MREPRVGKVESGSGMDKVKYVREKDKVIKIANRYGRENTLQR